MRLAVQARVGISGGGVGVASPRTRRLRQTLLVVLFLVRASARATVTASVSQIGGMLDRAVPKYLGIISSKLDSFQRQVEGKLEAFQGQVESKLESFHGQIEGLHQEVRQLARVHSNRHPERRTRLEPNQEHDVSSGSNTNIHLRFLNNWKPPIYTDKDITDENNVAIKVAMFEGDEMITSGPLSKAEIEVLVIHGGFYKKFQDNWTEEEFDKHIVRGRDEQSLVLGTVRLTNGEVELRQIRFKEGSCRKKFSMAARFCKSEKIADRVKEAIMEPVEVKDRRNESNEKSNSPRLDDDVYRIEAIARDGAYHQRLQEANIHTVQDFLKALNKDPDELYKILKMKKKGKSWSKMTEHARRRILEDRHELKAYQTEDGNVMLFFNCVHDLVGARFGSNYIACEQFGIDHKASVKRLKEHVYKYHRLQGIPYDYVMKGDAPERISLGIGSSAGPSGVSVDTMQPNAIVDNLGGFQDNQGTGATGNGATYGFDLVTEPIYTYESHGPMNTGPPDTYDGQVRGISPPCQQQTSLPPIGEWQEKAQVPTDSPDLFELARMNPDILRQSPGASIYDQSNLQPHHLPQTHQTAPAAALAWTPAQPLFPGQDQGPNCSLFPGSSRGNEW